MASWTGFWNLFENLFPLQRKLAYGAQALASNEMFRSKLPGPHNGPGDAYQHMLFSAELARLFGPEQARTILQYYELVRTVWDQVWDEYWMDTYNNEIGIQIGSTARSWNDVVLGVRARLMPYRNGDYGYAYWLKDENRWQYTPGKPDGMVPGPPNWKPLVWPALPFDYSTDLWGHQIEEPLSGNWRDRIPFGPPMSSLDMNDNDRYYVTTCGWTPDGETEIIEDKKGDNTVTINWIPVGSFLNPTEGNDTYRSINVDPNTHEKVFTAQYENGEDGTYFVITDTVNGTQVRLKDFEEGDFGIRFYDELTPPANPVTSNEIDGDLEPIDFNPEEPGIQVQDDQWGNVITDSQPDEGRNDILYDTLDNDLIIAGDGNDYVRTFRGGSDWIKGGEGDDLIDGERSINPIIEGGPGNDVLFGSYVSGSQVFADSYGDMQTLIDAGETAQSTNQKGDLLTAGYAVLNATLTYSCGWSSCSFRRGLVAFV